MRGRRRPAASARSLAPFRKGALQHRTAGGGAAAMLSAAADAGDAHHFPNSHSATSGGGDAQLYPNSHLASSGGDAHRFLNSHLASSGGGGSQHFCGDRFAISGSGGGGGVARELGGDPGGVDAVPVNAVAMCPRAAVAVTASKQLVNAVAMCPRAAVVVTASKQPVDAVAMCPRAAVAGTASKQDCLIRAWDLAGGDAQWHLDGHGVYASISVEGRAGVSTSMRETPDDWGAAAAAEVAVGGTAPPARAKRRLVCTTFSAVAFSPDGSLLASGDSAGVVKVWDIESRLCVMSTGSHQWQGYTTPVRQAGITPCNQYLMAVIGRALRVWSVATGELLRAIQMTSLVTTVSDLPRQELLCFAHLPARDGSGAGSLIAAGDVTVYKRMELAPILLCSLEQARAAPALNHFQWRLDGHSEAVTAMALSSDGAYLATGSADTTGKARTLCMQLLSGHRAGLCSIAFARGSTWVITGSNDGRMRVWHRDTGRCTQTVITGTCMCAVSGDENWVALYRGAEGVRGANRGGLQGLQGQGGSGGGDVQLADLGGLLYERRIRLLRHGRADSVPLTPQERLTYRAVDFADDAVFRRLAEFVV
ncbi:quinon protein alcohol dehydrogenase-like superfamily [Tribonema minus]|uniref:Quinon protein alcohol dehydrogenase-like superfamily n=1 Tax=Tribonema minus TaxID=303371 RepID=A0A835YV39_9STRA|nr:quinon protein alcohol dehydrogenase-like superfamily [Tribonema minus]